MIKFNNNLEKELIQYLQFPNKQNLHSIHVDRFMIFRQGGQETSFAFKKYNDNNQQPSDTITTGAGIYFVDEFSQRKYSKEYLELLKCVSLLGIWSRDETSERIRFYEDNNIKLMNATSEIIEPYYYFSKNNNILRNIIRNKRILVVSSHKKSIEHQIPFLDKIFAPYKIFENNSFTVIKPPQTHCGMDNKIDWTEHLKKFYTELDEIKDQFDLALLSCGGYGIFISNYICNKLNKNSIYIGGSLQLFFGIMGNRWKPWFTLEKFKYFPNKYWLPKPLVDDIPENFSKCEDGCYW